MHAIIHSPDFLKNPENLSLILVEVPLLPEQAERLLDALRLRPAQALQAHSDGIMDHVACWEGNKPQMS